MNAYDPFKNTFYGSHPGVTVKRNPPEKVKQPGTEQVHFCALCHGPGVSRHHLFPKSLLKQLKAKITVRLVRLCRPCHDDVHLYFSLWELAMTYNTVELIKTELVRRKEWCKTFLQNHE